jgi:hypothetical protein
VPFERQNRVVAHHSFAVVGDAHQTSAAELDVNLKRRAPASDRIFDNSLTTDAGRSTTSPAAI